MRRIKQCYNPKYYNVIEAIVDNPDRPPTSLKTISLFPLPNSVFYPGTILPLHIFEERADCVCAGDDEPAPSIEKSELQDVAANKREPAAKYDNW